MAPDIFCNACAQRIYRNRRNGALVSTQSDDRCPSPQSPDGHHTKAPVAITTAVQHVRIGDVLPVDGPTFGLSDADAVTVVLPNLGPTRCVLATVRLATRHKGGPVSLHFDRPTLDDEFRRMRDGEMLTVLRAHRDA